MKEISFFIDTEPQAWQRPKTHVVDGYVKHYSPTKTKKYEAMIAETYRQIKDAPFFEKDTAIQVTVHFDMPIPKSYSEKKKKLIVTGSIKHTKRPDCDNLTKAVLDALNGVAWEDDAQITRLAVRKVYMPYPCIWVRIAEDCD